MNIKIGCDFGQSGLKFAGADGALQFPALAALVGATSNVSLPGKQAKRPMLVSGAFGEFFVGARAHRWGVPLENFDFSRLAAETPEMRAIFYGAFAEYQRKHGMFEEPLEVVIGLPMQMMSASKDEAAKYARQVKDWIGGGHDWDADGERFHMDIVKVSLAPQAWAAMVDYAIGLDGKPIAENMDVLKRENGSIWIGSNTVELQVMEKDEDTRRFNGGATIGVRWLQDRVDPNGQYYRGEFNEKLRTGDLPEEMKAEVERYLDAWVGEIRGFVDRKWGQQAKRFYRVFIGGGGSLLIRDPLRTMFNGRSVFPKDPIMAIASGLYKVAVRS